MHCPRCGSKIADEEFICKKCGYLEDIAIIAKLKEAKPEEAKHQQNNFYAGFWKRCGAFIFDFLILTITEVLVAAVIGGVIFGMAVLSGRSLRWGVISGFASGFGLILAVGFNWAYFTGFESSKYQATFGKRMMGVYVVDLDSKRISFRRANARYWAKLLSLLVLFSGFILAGITKKKRALHDYIAGTMVFKK